MFVTLLKKSIKEGALTMFKKIGISLLLALTMLVSTFNVGLITTAYAAPCTTLAECRELERTARDNIADILGQEEELSAEMAEIQVEISNLRDDIVELEETISDLETDIADLAIDIANLADDIEDNLEILEDTEEQIEVLIDEISHRMRVTQRVNNTNSLFTLLSEAENVADFVRRTRTFNRFASDDAESMDELVDLIEIQENLLIELEDQTEQLGVQKTEIETLKDDLEAEQVNLETDQSVLIERETEMQDMLYELNAERITQEEVASAAAEAEEILARTPPPPVVSVAPVVSHSANDSSSSSSNNDSAASDDNSSSDTSSYESSPNDSDTTSETSPPEAAAAPAPSGGLAHPLPGGHVTSEFGPRGGRHHSGVDIVVAGNQSAPILAAASGTVTINQWHGSLGWYVVISHNINGQRVDTLYAHLRYQSSASVGSVVAQGQRIGTKGSTGHSTGAHLHFEVHPGGWAWGNAVNPRNWVGL